MSDHSRIHDACHGATLALLAAFALAAAPCPAHAQGQRTVAAGGTAGQHAAIYRFERLQAKTLPPLPAGMTVETIVSGDSIFHGKGACFACHGVEAEGLPAAGNALTLGLNWAQYQWTSIDSLINHGIPQEITRSPIMMPPRGGRSDLTPDEVRRVAAYVWAISQVQGEPWPGGHLTHDGMVPAGAAKGTASRVLIRQRPTTEAPLAAPARTPPVHAQPARKPSADERASASTTPAADPKVLRVCADPNNMPFSNAKGEGFENKIAEVVARSMGARVEYTWWPQRRGWVRNTLKAGTCDVAIGVPAGYELTLTTRPYYRSTYVFLSRADRHYGLRSLDDPRLRTLKIGLHFIGDDYQNPPPAHALGRRGIVRNIVGYSIYGDYRQANPPARLVDAVAKGDVDVAIAWGPLAGYFARHEPVKLDVVPVAPRVDPPGLPFTFAIAMGVRRNDTALRDTLQRVLDAKQAEIRRILETYGVPLVTDDGPR